MIALWKKVTSGVLLLLGIVLLALGVLTLIVLPVYFRQRIKDAAQLKANADGALGETAQKWAHPTMVMKMQYWFYNVDNPTGVYRHGQRPNVSLLGPYGFIEHQHKDAIRFENAGRTVRYRNSKMFVFSAAHSCANCTEGDLVTIPNILYLSLIDQFRHQSPVLRYAVARLAGYFGATPFVRRNVSQLLFDGYRDALLDLLRVARPQLPLRMGLFYGKNGSSNGVYEIRTGTEGADTFGDLLSWRNRTTLPRAWWLTPQARMLNGSDGGLWHPFLTRDRPLDVFVSDICRSVSLAFVGDSEYRDVATFRYTLLSSAFDPSLEANKGFRLPASDSYFSHQSAGSPLPKGFLNVSRCQPGQAPIVMSYPHFLYADGVANQRLDGLIAPNADEDATFLDIEPNTGRLMSVRQQLQINVAMHKDTVFDHMNTLANNTIIPVLISRETAYLGEDGYNSLKQTLLWTQTIAPIIAYVLVVFGICIVLTVCVYLAIVVYRNKQRIRGRSASQTTFAHDDPLNTDDADNDADNAAFNDDLEGDYTRDV